MTRGYVPHNDRPFPAAATAPEGDCPLCGSAALPAKAIAGRWHVNCSAWPHCSLTVSGTTWEEARLAWQRACRHAEGLRRTNRALMRVMRLVYECPAIPMELAATIKLALEQKN